MKLKVERTKIRLNLLFIGGKTDFVADAIVLVCSSVGMIKLEDILFRKEDGEEKAFANKRNVKKVERVVRFPLFHFLAHDMLFVFFLYLSPLSVFYLTHNTRQHNVF